MLKILCPNSLRDTQNLAEMHQLRYRKFVVELGWKDGISGVNQHEFDCFDHENAFYLVHVNELDKVDAVARLTQTQHPNLLMDIFKDNISLVEPKRSNDVIEISRFCSDATSAPKNVMGQIIAGLLQIGLTYNIDHFVSFSNTHIKPRATRIGWPAQEIGEVIQVGKDQAVSLKHDVRAEYYDAVFQNLNLKEPLLSEKEIARCPMKIVMA